MGKDNIVEVMWLDTYQVTGDGLTKKEVSELKPVSSVSYGRLIEKTDNHITIASTIMERGIGGEQPEYREVICIPKAAVKSVRELK